MLTGKKIRLIRNILGLSQEELAEKIGRTRALVSHIEQTGKVNHHTFLAILKTFKLTEADFDRIDDKAIRQSLYRDPQELPNEIKRLEEKISQINKDNKMLKELVETQKGMIDLFKSKNKK